MESFVNVFCCQGKRPAECDRESPDPPVRFFERIRKAFQRIRRRSFRSHRVQPVDSIRPTPKKVENVSSEPGFKHEFLLETMEMPNTGSSSRVFFKRSSFLIPPISSITTIQLIATEFRQLRKPSK